jgi:hypothetical protein
LGCCCRNCAVPRNVGQGQYLPCPRRLLRWHVVLVPRRNEPHEELKRDPPPHRSSSRCPPLAIQCDQGLRPSTLRGKEMQIRDLAFGPTESHCCSPGRRRCPRRGRPSGGATDCCCPSGRRV